MFYGNVKIDASYLLEKTWELSQRIKHFQYQLHAGEGEA